MKDIFCPNACKKITKEFCNKHSLLLECFLIIGSNMGQITQILYTNVFFFFFLQNILIVWNNSARGCGIFISSVKSKKYTQTNIRTVTTNRQIKTTNIYLLGYFYKINLAGLSFTKIHQCIKYVEIIPEVRVYREKITHNSLKFITSCISV